jgi:type I restriction enzyme S subunit
VDWLGDFPEHWEVLLLGRCVSDIEQGWSPVAADGDLEEDQWAVLTLSSVRRGSFNATAIKPVPKFAKIPNGIEVADGDFLLTRSNTRDRVGDVCIVEGVRPKTILCDLIYRLQIQHEKLNPRFLMYQLLAPLGRGQIERDARGSSGTMPKIAQGHIKAWKVVLPSLEEQFSIATYIDAETSKSNEIIDRSQREIDLICEYRSRLFTDVVTGKLDVRGVAVEVVEEELEDLIDADIEEMDEEMGEEELADA